MKTIATQIDSSVLPQRSYLNAQEIEQHWKKFPKSEWKVLGNWRNKRKEISMEGRNILGYMRAHCLNVEAMLARFTFIPV